MLKCVKQLKLTLSKLVTFFEKLYSILDTTIIVVMLIYHMIVPLYISYCILLHQEVFLGYYKHYNKSRKLLNANFFLSFLNYYIIFKVFRLDFWF